MCDKDQEIAGRGVGRPKLRLAHLDGIRAVAACYVVLHHIWTTVWPGYPDQIGPWWADWLKHGHFAVAIFIVVSGFSLALQPSRAAWQMDGGPGRFFSRRAWRIIPPYWAALLLSCLVIAMTSGVVHFLDGTIRHRELTVKSVVVHALLLQDVIGSPTPNGAFWSIAIEWQIYFLFPIVLIVRRRTGPIATAIAALGVTVAAYLLATNVAPFERILNLLPQFFALFVFGVLAVEAVRHREKVPRWLVPVSLIGFAGVLAIGEILGDRETVRQFFWFDLGIGACTAALLAGLCGQRDSVVRSALAAAPARALGRFSYSIYLVHLPILTLVWLYIVIPLATSPNAAFAMLTGFGATAVILGAWLFSLVFEEPFIRHRSWGEFRSAKPKPAAVMPLVVAKAVE